MNHHLHNTEASSGSREASTPAYRRSPDQISPPERGDVLGRVIDSYEILGGNRQALIRHNNEIYRLVITRNNKLILQK